MTNKWIGYIMRRKLSIKTQKSHGLFMIPLTEHERLKRLYEKYGLVDKVADNQGEGSRVDIGEVGDVGPEAGVG